MCSLTMNCAGHLNTIILIKLVIPNRLKSGEALLLNNRRVLHSRISFQLNGGGSRCLQVVSKALTYKTQFDLSIHKAFESARSSVTITNCQVSE